MNWSNEKVLEFIENYEAEHILWNPQENVYKKKYLIYDAWVRIKNNLSWATTVDDLKKKRDSLMAYYRTHQNRYKNSVKSGASADDVYQSNWYAFSAMDSFLRPIYACEPTVHTQISENYEDHEENTIPSSEDTTTSQDLRSRRSTGMKRKIESGSMHARSQMQEALEHLKGIINDEYEIFGRLIASKIRKIQNPGTKEILMNDIHNSVFRASMIYGVSRQTVQVPSSFNSPYSLTTYQSPPAASLSLDTTSNIPVTTRPIIVSVTTSNIPVTTRPMVVSVIDQSSSRSSLQTSQLPPGPLSYRSLLQTYQSPPNPSSSRSSLQTFQLPPGPSSSRSSLQTSQLPPGPSLLRSLLQSNIPVTTRPIVVSVIDQSSSRSSLQTSQLPPGPSSSRSLLQTYQSPPNPSSSRSSPQTFQLPPGPSSSRSSLQTSQLPSGPSSFRSSLQTYQSPPYTISPKLQQNKTAPKSSKIVISKSGEISSVEVETDTVDTDDIE